MEVTQNKQSTAQNHIKELKKIGYVRDGLIPSVDGSVLYEITEPRIRYLISRGLTAIE